MKQLCVLKFINNVTNISCRESHEQRCVLKLINNVTNITCTEPHEGALCTEFDYKRHQHNVHRIA
jgi:hypothetical protein